MPDRIKYTGPVNAKRPDKTEHNVARVCHILQHKLKAGECRWQFEGIKLVCKCLQTLDGDNFHLHVYSASKHTMRLI